MQKLEKNMVETVLPLALNGIISTRKVDKDLINKCRLDVGADQDFIIDEVVRIHGTVCVSGEKKDRDIKASPDWKGTLLAILNSADAAIKTKAKKLLNETKTGSKVDLEKLNLSKWVQGVQDGMNEVIATAPSLPSVTVRCRYQVVSAEAKAIAVETLTVPDVAVLSKTKKKAKRKTKA